MQKLRNLAYNLLRWSEKYTKTDMVYLTKGGFWVTFGQVFSNVLSLLLVIAFANLLPKETYGYYRYILSIASVLNIFTLTGMNSAVARAVAGGNDSVFKKSVSYQLKWNLLMLSAFVVIGLYFLYLNNLVFALSFFVLGLFTPLTLAFNTYGSFLEGKKNFKLASIASIVSSFIYVIGVFAAILLSGDIFWLIMAYTLTTFVSTLFFYLFITFKYNLKNTFPNNNDNETIQYGRKLTFIGFIGPIASQVDKILLAHFWGPTQLAIYSLAMAVPERATSLIKNWVGIGFPKFANKTPVEINSVFYRRIFQGLFVGLLATIGYIVLAPFLFKYLLPQYLESTFYSQILAIGMIFAIPNCYISLLLVSQKYARSIFTNSLIQNILKIILFAVLGVWGGILGLVIATIINTAISLLINIYIWRKTSLAIS